jgi:HD-GYP domain-containing protein (c-di-GMP phosphodiesterase class II)
MQPAKLWRKAMAGENIAAPKKLRTKDLKDGMRFTDTVFIDKRNILVGPNAPIKQKDIERLLKWGINELETSGELITEDTPPDVLDLSKKQDEKLASAVKAELEKLGAAPADPAATKKQRAPDTGAYVKRDCSIQRSLKEYYHSWLDDIDRMYQLAVDDYDIDKNDSIRIAGEILEKVRAERDALVNLMKKGKKRTYLAVHGVNVAIYAAMLGNRLDMRDMDLLHFILGCLFIDIGMVKVPLSLFAKESKPNPEELRNIRAHPVYGYKILVQDNGFPKEVGLVALEHHERTNGSGYPRKLSVNQISAFGRIAAILDTYEAMTSQRSYREEYISHEAMRNVVALGQANFDKQYLAIFLREIGVYPVGTYVRLNNNIIALVVAANPSAPMRPEIKILLDEFGDPVNQTEIIRLAQENDLTITKALNEKEKQALEIS